MLQGSYFQSYKTSTTLRSPWHRPQGKHQLYVQLQGEFRSTILFVVRILPSQMINLWSIHTCVCKKAKHIDAQKKKSCSYDLFLVFVESWLSRYRVPDKHRVADVPISVSVTQDDFLRLWSIDSAVTAVTLFFLTVTFIYVSQSLYNLQILQNPESSM